nr:MAG TPA: hypothetical protein [Caudoviricetes sp.]
MHCFLLLLCILLAYIFNTLALFSVSFVYSVGFYFFSCK